MQRRVWGPAGEAACPFPPALSPRAVQAHGPGGHGADGHPSLFSWCCGSWDPAPPPLLLASCWSCSQRPGGSRVPATPEPASKSISFVLL